MSERRQKKSVYIDLVGAIRRAYMRRGVLIPPVSSGQPQAKPSRVAKDQENNSQPPEQSDDEDATPTDKTGSQEPQEVHEKLIDITEKAQDVLFEADTVFPFTLFPDTITIDREKVTIATRTFFRVARITSAPLTSIINAEASMGPFFGSVTISSKYFVHNTYSVNFLTRGNALSIQHMLQGFIIAQEKKIDLTDIDKRDLRILLTDLGQGVPD